MLKLFYCGTEWSVLDDETAQEVLAMLRDNKYPGPVTLKLFRLKMENQKSMSIFLSTFRLCFTTVQQHTPVAQSSSSVGNM